MVFLPGMKINSVKTSKFHKNTSESAHFLHTVCTAFMRDPNFLFFDFVCEKRSLRTKPLLQNTDFYASLNSFLFQIVKKIHA